MDAIVINQKENEQYDHYLSVQDTLKNSQKILEDNKNLIQQNQSLQKEIKQLKKKMIKISNMKLQDLSGSIPRVHLKQFLKENGHESIYLDDCGLVFPSKPVQMKYDKINLNPDEKTHEKKVLFYEKKQQIEQDESILRLTCQRLREQIQHLESHNCIAENGSKEIIINMQKNSLEILEQYRKQQTTLLEQQFYNTRCTNALRNYIKETNQLIDYTNDANTQLNFLDTMNQPQFFTEKQLIEADQFLKKQLKKIDQEKQERGKNKFCHSSEKGKQSMAQKIRKFNQAQALKFPIKEITDFEKCIKKYGLMLDEEGDLIDSVKSEKIIREKVRLDDLKMKQLLYRNVQHFFKNFNNINTKIEEQQEKYDISFESPSNTEESEEAEPEQNKRSNVRFTQDYDIQQQKKQLENDMRNLLIETGQINQNHKPFEMEKSVKSIRFDDDSNEDEGKQFGRKSILGSGRQLQKSLQKQNSQNHDEIEKSLKKSISNVTRQNSTNVVLFDQLTILTQSKTSFKKQTSLNVQQQEEISPDITQQRSPVRRQSSFAGIQGLKKVINMQQPGTTSEILIKK